MGVTVMRKFEGKDEVVSYTDKEQVLPNSTPLHRYFSGMTEKKIRYLTIYSK